jgi:DNA gyrase subunit A
MPVPNARGRPIINWIPLEAGEKVQAVLPVREYADGQYVFFATRDGTVKKTPLTEFAYRLARGKIAINLDEGDALVGVALTDGQRDIMLFASNGKTVRFGEGKVRSTGRTATGVRGIRMAKGEEVVSLIVAESAGGIELEDDVGNEVAVEETSGEPTSSRVAIDDGLCVHPDRDRERLRQAHAAGRIPAQGPRHPGRDRHPDQRAQRQAGRRGPAEQHDEVLLISDGGTLVRTRAAEISQVGRNTQGVTLIRCRRARSCRRSNASTARWWKTWRYPARRLPWMQSIHPRRPDRTVPGRREPG